MEDFFAGCFMGCIFWFFVISSSVMFGMYGIVTIKSAMKELGYSTSEQIHLESQLKEEYICIDKNL